MPRLIVNPASPTAWEIQLLPGVNRIGRGFANDFTIDDPSVSSQHCQISVSDEGIVLTDLGSTNGTFVDRAPVRETRVRAGQVIRLGGVEMRLADDPAVSATAAPVNQAVFARPVAVGAAVAVGSPRTATAAVATLLPAAGTKPCKYHPKSPARFHCPKCDRSYCGLCVITSIVAGTAHTSCRSCGTQCEPLQVTYEAPPPEKGFYARLPGALLYPFRGYGVLVFIVATLFITGLQLVSRWSIYYRVWVIILTYGYIFCYMQDIIHATATGEEEMPQLPPFEGLFTAFFRLVGTVAVSFAIPIPLLVAKLSGVDVPVPAMMGAVLAGCVYFPMAFLAVAIKDTVVSANPLVVVPSITRVPREYLVTVVLFGAIVALQGLGDILSRGIGGISFATREMSELFLFLGIQVVWSFLSMYLLTVNMRILGLLYLTRKDELGW